MVTKLLLEICNELVIRFIMFSNINYENRYVFSHFPEVVHHLGQNNRQIQYGPTIISRQFISDHFFYVLDKSSKISMRKSNKLTNFNNFKTFRLLKKFQEI